MLPAHPRKTLLHPASSLQDVAAPVYLEQQGQSGVMIKTHRALVIDRAFRIALRGITGLAIGMGIGLAMQVVPLKQPTSQAATPQTISPIIDKTLQAKGARN